MVLVIPVSVGITDLGAITSLSLFTISSVVLSTKSVTVFLDAVTTILGSYTLSIGRVSSITFSVGLFVTLTASSAVNSSTNCLASGASLLGLPSTDNKLV